MHTWNQPQPGPQSWYKLGGPPNPIDSAVPDQNGPPPEYRPPPELTNGYDNKANHNVVDHYYYPDSDLETIVEESSVLDSEDERGFYNHDDVRNPPQRRSFEHHRTPQSSDSSYSSLSSASTPRQDRPYDDNSPSRQNAGSNVHQREEFAPVNPFAQQKIVYAKCLTPRNELAQRSEVKPNQTIDTDVDEAMDHSTITDMFEAAMRGDLHALNSFSASELNDTVDERGNTALHVAAENGHLPCIRRLVSTSNPNLITLPNDDLMTPTAMAIKNGHIGCVQWLVRHTVAREELSISKRPSSFDGSSTRPPIAHVAARYDRNEILDWLCEEMKDEGYPIDTADHCSNTPVHVAARYGHLACIQTLVSRGASVTMLNSDGDTPGQAAQKYDHDTCVGYLVVVETCVSLAQQVVALRNDMEALRTENEQLKKNAQSVTHKSNSNRSPVRNNDRGDATRNVTSNGLPSPPPPQVNGFHDLPLPPPPNMDDLPPSVEYKETKQPSSPDKLKSPKFKSASQRRVLQEQPPPPKLTNSSSPPTSPQIKDAPAPKTAPHQSKLRKRPQLRGEAPKTGGSTSAGGADANPSMQEMINAALNGPGTSLDETGEKENGTTETDSPMLAPVAQNGDTNRGVAANQKTNDEVETLTKDMPEAPQKKSWEKLSMDEMLKLVRDIRYQPSPSISLCTEDSTMESVEVMRERLAAASRWFLVERTRNKAPTHSQGITSNPAPRTNHGRQRTNNANPRQKNVAAPNTAKSLNNTPPRDKNGPAVSWVAPPSGYDQQQTVTSQSERYQSRGQTRNIASAATQIKHFEPTAKTQQPRSTTVVDSPPVRQSGTLKFMVTNGKSTSSSDAMSGRSRVSSSPDDKSSTNSLSPKKVSSYVKSPQGTPPLSPNSNFTAQRNSSYRRAVDKQQQQQQQQQQQHDPQHQSQQQHLQQRVMDTRSSSDSLSSGSSRNTSRSQSSDKRSTVSSKSSRSGPVQSPLAQSSPPKPTDPLQKRTAKDLKILSQNPRNPDQHKTGERVKPEEFKTIERPVPVRKYQPPIRPVTVNNPNRAPFSWSLPRGYTATQSYYKPYNNSQDLDEDEMQPASEVPELKAEIPSRQSSFLRKVQGKFK